MRFDLMSAAPLTWTFIGDSITEGTVHTGTGRHYVQLVEERIRGAWGRTLDTVQNRGVSGWKVEDVLARLDWVLAPSPDVIALMIGTNDAGRADFDPARFRAEIEELLGRLVAADPRLLLVQVPTPVLDADRRRETLPVVQRTIREVVPRGAILVDHALAWRPLVEAGGVERWLSDTLHPNALGHQAMAKEVLRSIGVEDSSASPGGELLG